MLLRRRAFWVLRAGVMGHFVLCGLGVRNSGTKEADEGFKTQTRSLRFLETASWVTSPGTGPSTHLEPITVHLPVPQDGL